METEKIKSLVREVLQKGYVMSLGTVDEGGVWVADVIYVFDSDLNIYWISSPRVRHSEALLKNPRVAGTITVSSQEEDNLGLQFEGVAEKVEDPRYDLVVKHFGKRKKPIPENQEDVLKGRSWYILKPKKIELIYESLFGFHKQRLEL